MNATITQPYCRPIPAYTQASQLGKSVCWRVEPEHSHIHFRFLVQSRFAETRFAETPTLTLTLNPNFGESGFGESGRHPLTYVLTHGYVTSLITNCTNQLIAYSYKPVDELARVMLSFKRPTRPPSNCDSTVFIRNFTVGDRITPNASSPRVLSRMN